MSWTDEEIDNLFKDGANAQTFKYDDAYFAEMEAASLPVNKKGKDFLWMGTALLFVAVLTTGYFINDTNENQFGTNNNQLANLELNTTNNENAVDSKTSNNDQQSINNNTENGTNSNSDADAASMNGVNTDGTNTVSLKNVSGTDGYTPSQNGVSSKSTYNGPNPNKAKSNTLAITKAAATSSIGMSIDSKPSTAKPLIDSKAGTQNNAQKEFIVVRGPITAGLDVNSPNQLDHGITQNIAPNALPLPMLSELRPKAAFYVELNGGVSQSLITPSDEISKSLGGGIGVETYLGNFNLTTGLNFKASHHDDLFLTETGKVYGFGSTAGRNTYDIQKVYSFELPISLGYNFGNHNVNVGVRPSYLIGGKMRLQAFSDEKLLRTERINALPTAAKIELVNKDGFKNYFGMKPTIGYAYRMKNWTIGGNIGVQLVQSVNEELIEGVNNTLPIDGQIYIRKTIRLRR